MAEIWRGTELGFEDTGVYAGLQGKTIDTITYYLNNGKIQTIAANIKVPKSTKNVTATVENALNTAREAVVTVKNRRRTLLQSTPSQAAALSLAHTTSQLQTES